MTSKKNTIKEERLLELYLEKYLSKTQYCETLNRIRKSKEKQKEETVSS